MPLKFQPAELKFNDFQPMPDKAVADFAKLAAEIAHGTNQEKDVFEDLKAVFGKTWKSTSLRFAPDDLMLGMNEVKVHAAKFVAAFYFGIEKIKKRGVDVPPDEAINKILTKHGVPLAIGDPCAGSCRANQCAQGPQTGNVREGLPNVPR